MSPPRRMWVWASIRPGRHVDCDRSTTRAPAGLATSRPTFWMRAPSTTTMTFATGAGGDASADRARAGAAEAVAGVANTPAPRTHTHTTTRARRMEDMAIF